MLCSGADGHATGLRPGGACKPHNDVIRVRHCTSKTEAEDYARRRLLCDAGHGTRATAVPDSASEWDIQCPRTPGIACLGQGKSVLQAGFNPVAGCQLDAAAVIVNDCGTKDDCSEYVVSRNVCRVGYTPSLTAYDHAASDGGASNHYEVSCNAPPTDGGGLKAAVGTPPSSGGGQVDPSDIIAPSSQRVEETLLALTRRQRVAGVAAVTLAVLTLVLFVRYARWRSIVLCGASAFVACLVYLKCRGAVQAILASIQDRDQQPCPVGDVFDMSVNHCVPIGYGDKCDVRQLGATTCVEGYVCNEGRCMLAPQSRNDGEGCRFNGECYSGTCLIRPGLYQGYCKPSNISSCTRSETYSKEFGACIPSDGYGTACVPTDIRPCSNGYICDPLSKRCLVSKREGKDGASCLTDAECFSGSCAFGGDGHRRGVCSYGPSAMCGLDEELMGSVCVPSGYASKCDTSKTTTPCAVGLHCTASASGGGTTCRKLARSLDDGAACAYHSECASVRCDKSNAISGGLGFCDTTAASSCSAGEELYKGECVVAGYMQKCDMASVDACPAPLACVETQEMGARCTRPYRSRADDTWQPNGPPQAGAPPAAFSLRSSGGAHVEFAAPPVPPSVGTGDGVALDPPASTMSCSVNEECKSLLCQGNHGASMGTCVATPSSKCNRDEKSVRDICLPVLYDTPCDATDASACRVGVDDASPSALRCVRTRRGSLCAHAEASMPDAHLCLHDEECISKKCKVMSPTEMGFCHPTKESECRQTPGGGTGGYEYNKRYKECLPVGYGRVCDDSYSAHCAGLTCALSLEGHRCMLGTKSVEDGAACGFDYECASGECVGKDIRLRIRGVCGASSRNQCADGETYVRSLDMCVPPQYADACDENADCEDAALSCVPNVVGGRSSCRFIRRSKLLTEKCTSDAECVTGKCRNLNDDHRHGVCVTGT